MIPTTIVLAIAKSCMKLLWSSVIVLVFVALGGGKMIVGGIYMSKHGRSKMAYFEDCVIIECNRSCDLKRAVRARREIEGYYGLVWFRPCEAWQALFTELPWA